MTLTSDKHRSVRLGDNIQTTEEYGRVRTLEFQDASKLRELSGELAQNLKVVGKQLGVRVDQRGQQVTVLGHDGSVDLAASVIEQLYQLVGRGLQVHPILVEHGCRLIRQDADAKLVEYFTDVVFTGHRKKQIFPRSLNQRLYVEAIRSHELVFGIGPAGTGKTYLAMASAVAALMSRQVNRIILCRPAVEAGEKLGYLPGDLAEKVNPYLRPLYDALYDMVDLERADRLMQKNVIEVAPLAFMRGRTLSDAFVIMDEAQNTTSEQMKMFLTRLGTGSRAVVTGDITQVDLPERTVSGLVEASNILQGVQGIGFVRFQVEDVVRHQLVGDIIRAYDRHGRRGRGRERFGGEE